MVQYMWGGGLKDVFPKKAENPLSKAPLISVGFWSQAEPMRTPTEGEAWLLAGVEW